MDTAKTKIATVVSDYMRDSRAEYGLLVSAIEQHRYRIDDKTDFTNKSDMMPLYELSETLQVAIALGLAPAELTWWKTREGGRWFAGAYPQFSLQ